MVIPFKELLMHLVYVIYKTFLFSSVDQGTNA